MLLRVYETREKSPWARGFKTTGEFPKNESSLKPCISNVMKIVGFISEIQMIVYIYIRELLI